MYKRFFNYYLVKGGDLLLHLLLFPSYKLQKGQAQLIRLISPSLECLLCNPASISSTKKPVKIIKSYTGFPNSYLIVNGTMWAFSQKLY
ncbi:hypothetical protein J2S21_004355 [Peribacillus cavernae]|nr:hypothetical protein [Peribacillus cavernae]